MRARTGGIIDVFPGAEPVSPFPRRARTIFDPILRASRRAA
ncbi:hypothetical protein BURCENBC7_AP5313 [Burkholderia cenocepacia BC7]|nr:hypothetical protein BURCENK562V_C2334 [Burkholderia cenocepacia K56-2Valvano]ERI30813.1 hypothetical protein BURCENBC7_AP5313 [Burkholderia cenocepacia BC7]